MRSKKFIMQLHPTYPYSHKAEGSSFINTYLPWVHAQPFKLFVFVANTTCSFFVVKKSIVGKNKLSLAACFRISETQGLLP